MTSNGYIVNEADKCVYHKFDNDIGVIICLYVDDMLILGTNMVVINEAKHLSSSSFDMKDIGEANVILRIKLTKINEDFKMSQEHFVEKILKMFGHFHSKPISTPHNMSIQTSISQSDFAQIIGSLTYLMNCTRPDIAYVEY